MTAYSWTLYPERILHENIVSEGYTLCWAAKWYKKGPVLFDSVYQSDPDAMIGKIYTLLDEADAVVTYNGVKFDLPILQQEFLRHGLNPPSGYFNIDLLKTVRRQFRFPSNKLDYVAKRLGYGGKIEHKGMELWRGCMAGNAADWKIMRKYNIRDVTLLEQVYEHLLCWIPRHPNWGHWVDSAKPTCAKCGSDNLVMNGKETRTTIPYQRYLCRACGSRLKGEVMKTEPRPTTKAA